MLALEEARGEDIRRPLPHSRLCNVIPCIQASTGAPSMSWRPPSMHRGSCKDGQTRKFKGVAGA